MHASNAQQKLKYWWFPLLFGLAFIALGVWIMLAPKESLSTLTKIIGVITIISGTTQLLFTFSNRRGIPGWGFQLSGGIIDLVVGIILVVNPTILLKIITLFVGVWLVVSGITLIIRATKTREAGRAIWKWELGLGVALLVLAAIFMWHPVILGLTIALWASLAFIFLGVFRILLTLQLRRKSIVEIHVD